MKIIIVLFLLFLAVNLYAASLDQEPTLNMGSAVYVTDNSGVANVIVTNHQGDTSTSGSGPLGNLIGTVATGAIYSDITRKRIDIEIKGGSSGTVIGTCGTINVTNISIDGNSTATFQKGDSALSNGVRFSMTASFSGTPTQSCTISGPISGVTFDSHDTTNGNQGSWIRNSPINVSLNLTLPNYLEHDTGAKLNFGTFCRSNRTQTLTVTQAGTVGNADVDCPVGNDISADSFTFNTAASSVPFSVNLPSGTINISNGTDNLTINNFTSSCGNSCSTSGGSATFTVGATITVPGGATVGSYTGTYPVSVTY